MYGNHYQTIYTNFDISASPSSGYLFDYWLFDSDVGGDGSTTSSITSVVMSKNRIVEPHFKNREYFVTLNQSPGGYISYKSGYEPTHNGGYYIGENVIIVAVPNFGFSFTSWLVSGATVDTTIPGQVSFYMPANDVSVTPTFTADQSYQVSATLSDGGWLNIEYLDSSGTPQFINLTGEGGENIPNACCAISIINVSPTDSGNAYLTGFTC